MRVLLALVLSLSTAGMACAQPSKWPDRPLRFIVPLPPGSAADVMARVIAQRLTVKLRQPVIVENRAGASGIIGSDLVAKSPPDGYTLGIATSTTHITAPILNLHLPYDPVKDFAPVAMVGLSPYVLVVNPNVPVKSVAELIALAKAKPKTLSYSSVGNASQAHLSGELFSTLAGVQLNHIPYRSSTHAVIDLNEGRIDMQFGILGTSLTLIREGKLRALATTTEKRTEELPDVPTMAEAGLPGFKAALVFAVVMPTGTPAPIVAQLNKDIAEIMAAPEVKQTLSTQAIEARSSTPDALRDRIAQEIDLWQGLAKKVNIKPE
ncbi:MAG: tripartite tricarboxylate transporter substrate binding protein [Pseudomonadota bacterium]